MIVAFDVDGTLINDADEPRHDVIDLLRAMHRLGIECWVWSGGGLDYAARWVERLGLSRYVKRVCAKDPKLPVDIAVDDVLDADLGRLGVLYV